jgi:hypothetical protein
MCAALTLPLVTAVGCAGSRSDTPSMASYIHVDVPTTLDELASARVQQGALVVVGTVGGFEAGKVGIDAVPPELVQSGVEELVQRGRLDIQRSFGPNVTPSADQILPLLDEEDILSAFGPGVGAPYLAVTVLIERVIMDDGYLGSGDKLVVREWHPLPKPHLEPGDRYLLFLSRDPEGWYSGYDPMPGTFHLEPDRVTDWRGDPAPMAGDSDPDTFVARAAEAVASAMARATETGSAYP